jgi:sugar/nucleoside kinase (ribokinase family)
MHVSRGISLAGYTLAVGTIAGQEAEARDGLDELGRVAALHVQRSRTTTRFRHRAYRSGRRLYLEAPAVRLAITQPLLDLARPSAVLFAPVAGEIGPGALRLFGDAPWRPVRAANLQGWLRVLRVGHAVSAIRLRSLGRPLAAALSSMDLIVVSREDLAERSEPWNQVDELRHRFGDRPVLVLTDGVEGAWIDDRRMRPLRGGDWVDRWHQPVPTRVDGVSTVGAGDVLAGLFAVQLRWSFLRDLRPLIVAAMEGVARFLEARR